MDLSNARLQAKAILGEIKPPSNRQLTEVGRNESSELGLADKFRGMTPTDFPIPELLHFGLTKLLDAKPYGPFEKMRWGFLFDFKDGTFGFELQKFGLRVLCEPSKLDSPLLRELLGRSVALTNVVEQYLSSGVIPDQINAGNFTVRNLSLQLRGRYEFLREKAELVYATPIPPPQTTQGQFGPVTTYHLGKPVHEGGSLGTAAVDAYFSMTEHLFCLALPFSSNHSAGTNILDFLYFDWSSKAKLVLDLDDASTKEAYDGLLQIRSEWRNPIEHGGFLSGGGSLYVHIPGTGALPARLRRTPKGAYFGFRMSDDSFGEIMQVFEKFDAQLRTGEIGYALKWAESGLDVAFDSKSISEYRAAMTSGESFEALIDRTGYFTDLHVNMDY